MTATTLKAIDQQTQLSKPDEFLLQGPVVTNTNIEKAEAILMLSRVELKVIDRGLWVDKQLKVIKETKEHITAQDTHFIDLELTVQNMMYRLCRDHEDVSRP